MTNDQIEKFLSRHPGGISKPVRILFKARSAMEGVFIDTGDYSELKSKNFWRIVPGGNLENYKRSKDAALARMFNGEAFAKLTAI